MRECLQDVYDVPALVELMRGIATRRVRVAEVGTESPSPFAAALLFGYVGAFMYEGDSPLAERRAAALALDTTLLAELLGRVELRELLDADVIAATAGGMDAVIHAEAANRAACWSELGACGRWDGWLRLSAWSPPTIIDAPPLPAGPAAAGAAATGAASSAAGGKAAPGVKLASGARAILEAARTGGLRAEGRLLISNNESAAAHDVARDQIGSTSMLAKRSTKRFCTVSLPR